MYSEFITLYCTDYQWASTHVKKWKSVLKNKPSKHGHWTETGFLTVSETLQTLQTPSLSSAFILFNLSAAFDTVHLYLLVPGTHAELRLWESEPGKAQLISYFANIPVFFIMCTAQPLLFYLYTIWHGVFHLFTYVDSTQLHLIFLPSDIKVEKHISSSWLPSLGNFLPAT